MGLQKKSPLFRQDNGGFLEIRNALLMGLEQLWNRNNEVAYSSNFCLTAIRILVPILYIAVVERPRDGDDTFMLVNYAL